MFPIKMSYSEGAKTLKGATDHLDYTRRLLTAFVQDTPFCSGDVYEVHEEVRESLPENLRYATSSIQRGVWKLKKTGEIEVLDDNHSQAKDYVYVWMGKNGYGKKENPDPSGEAGDRGPGKLTLWASSTKGAVTVMGLAGAATILLAHCLHS